MKIPIAFFETLKEFQDAHFNHNSEFQKNCFQWQMFSKICRNCFCKVGLEMAKILAWKWLRSARDIQVNLNVMSIQDLTDRVLKDTYI